jgi:hypothetical protein
MPLVSYFVRIRSSIEKGGPMAGQRKGNDNDRFVVPNKDRGGWDVVKEDHKRASAHTERKSEALDRGRQIVHNAGGGELRIANKHGRLIDSDTIKPGHESSRRDTK